MSLSPQNLAIDAVELLKKLISTPSMSREEDATAGILADFFTAAGIPFERKMHNIIARSQNFSEENLPVILLNSHHDTVPPAAGYSRDPYLPFEDEGKIFGLGSNDAGASLVSLIAVFRYFYARPNLPFRLILAATAEEEIGGKNGIAAVLADLGPIDLAVVGEPTGMQPAASEKGLIVADGIARGIAGHAARNEGENAIYKALTDVEKLRTFEFPKVSELLGPVKVSVTVIKAGDRHNVVPDRCDFTVDIRTTDAYTNRETIEILQQQLESELVPRSLRLNPSGIPAEHPFLQKALAEGLNPYGSPTLSDQSLIPFDSVKIGPGESARSHTADEFIFTDEIIEAVPLYIRLLTGLKLNKPAAV